MIYKYLNVPPRKAICKYLRGEKKKNRGAREIDFYEKLRGDETIIFFFYEHYITGVYDKVLSHLYLLVLVKRSQSQHRRTWRPI